MNVREKLRGEKEGLEEKEDVLSVEVNRLREEVKALVGNGERLREENVRLVEGKRGLL